MTTQYLESMLQDLSDVMKKELGITPILAGGVESYPFVTMQCEGRCFARGGLEQYRTIDTDGNTHIHDIDYRETVLMSITPQVVIAAVNIQELIDMESLITKMYAEPRNLFAAHPNIEGEKLPFQVVLNTAKEIKRSQTEADGKSLYSSIIPLKASNGVSFYKALHPVQLAFDEKLKADTLQRISAIGWRWHCLEGALDSLHTSYQHTDLQDEQVRDRIRTRANIDGKNSCTDGDAEAVWLQMERYPQLNAKELSTQLEADKREVWKIYSDLMEQTQILPKEMWNEESVLLVHRIADIKCREKCDLSTAIQKGIGKENHFKKAVERMCAEASEAAVSQPRPSQPQEHQESPSGGSFLGSVFSAAAGVALGSEFSRREAKRQTELLQEQTRQIQEQKKAAERAENERRRREAAESQRKWREVHRVNQERRRKGLPELPYPPRHYW